MTKIDNLTHGNLGDAARELRQLRYSTPLNGSSVGRGGMRFYGTGKLLVENEGLEVTGTATITGILNADGTVNLTGIIGISGPLTVTGTTALNGQTTIAGDTTVNGDLTTNGPLDVNGTTTLDGDTTVTGPFHVNGATDINGNLDVDGTLDINGAATLNNDLTVAAGRRIMLGGLILENQSADSGQVQFPGGGISTSTALGMFITSETVEIAGTTVKISNLPTTAEPANLHVDADGVISRSTAA